MKMLKQNLFHSKFRFSATDRLALSQSWVYISSTHLQGLKLNINSISHVPIIGIE